jgi:hypothetical protein
MSFIFVVIANVLSKTSESSFFISQCTKMHQSRIEPVIGGFKFGQGTWL